MLDFQAIFTMKKRDEKKGAYEEQPVLEVTGVSVGLEGTWTISHSGRHPKDGER